MSASLRRLFVTKEPDYDTSLPLPRPPLPVADSETAPGSPTSSLAPLVQSAGQTSNGLRTRAQTAALCDDAIAEGSWRRRINETDGLGAQSLAWVLGCPTCSVTPWSGTAAEKLRAARIHRLASSRFLEVHVRARLAGVRVSLSDPVHAGGAGSTRTLSQVGGTGCDSALVGGGMLALLPPSAMDARASILRMPDLARVVGQPGSEAAALVPRRQGLLVHDDSPFLRGPPVADDLDRGVVETLTPPESIGRLKGPGAVPTHVLPRRAGTMAATDSLWARLRYEGLFDFSPLGVVARDSADAHLQLLTGTLLKQLHAGQQVDVVVLGRAHLAWGPLPMAEPPSELVERARRAGGAMMMPKASAGTPVPNARLYVLVTGLLLIEEALVAIGKGEARVASPGVQEAAKRLVEFARSSTTTFGHADQAAADALFAAPAETMDVVSEAERAGERALEGDDADVVRTPRATVVRPRLLHWTFGGVNELPPLRAATPGLREVVLGGWCLGKILDSKATHTGVVEVQVDVSGFVSGDELAQRYDG